MVGGGGARAGRAAGARGGVATLTFALACGAAAASSDTRVGASIFLTRVHDDNIFFSSGEAVADEFTRFSPELRLISRAPRLTAEGWLALDAERFDAHPELSTTRARETAAFDLAVLAGRRWTFGLDAAYVSTFRPGELNPLTGLEAGRLRARRLALGGTASVQIGPRGALRTGLTATRDAIDGGASTDTSSATLGFERRISPRDELDLDLAGTRFDFGDGEPVSALALTLGWERRLSPAARLALRAGPRLSEGDLDPEGTFEIGGVWKRAEASFAYARSLTTVVGRAGTVTTESVATTLTLRPAPPVSLSLSPALYRIADHGGDEATARALAAEASFRLTDWLSLTASYRGHRQEGTLDGGPGGDGGRIARDIFFLGIVAAHRPGRRPPGE
jgi:hypothetical protein